MAEPAFEQTRDTPGFKVLVRGSELPAEAALDLMEVTVSDYVEGASLFTLTFNNWNGQQQEFKWLDDTLLNEGTPIEVRIGFVDHFESLIVGEVTALEPEFHDSEAPTLRLHGYDLLHRLRRGRKTRSFTNMKDSQIAEQVASNLNLRAQVEDTQVVHEYVLQDNLTDIDFLLQRARRIRYEVLVQDKTLLFRKAANDQGQVVELTYGQTLRAFYPRLNTLQQVSEVRVQGWDPKTKQTLVGRARQGDESTRMGGTQLGVSISEQAFFPTQRAIVDTPVFSTGEATQIAKGKFNDMTVEFITGEGVAVGNTALRAGRVITLQGLGQRFSGLYYLTSSTHVIDQAGYTTRFTVQRNAT
jgi:phage protein D